MKISKRFTETQKWDDPWFVRLSWQGKLLWLYICDRCDASGVIDLCPELASVAIGAQITEESLAQFGDRVKKLENGKWQIIKFLPFQYGTVDANCPAHKRVIRLISANNLQYPINNLSNRVFNTLEEEDKKKKRQYPIQNPTQRPMTKFGIPLPPRCTIDQFDNVRDYTGRIMDINQVRKAATNPR